MALIVDTKEYLNTICQLLQEGKQDLPVPVTGNSMCPFLHPGDIVYLNRYTELEKGDIVLVPTRDAAQGREVIRKVAVAHENHRVDPEHIKYPLKKIIGVVRRRAEQMFTAMITGENEDHTKS